MTTRSVLGALILGALVRLSLLAIPLAWHDEATTGLIGLAVLRGDLPIYFFGQPFMGALDAYLAAPVYAVLGTSYATLKLLPALLSIVWTGLAARLAQDLGGVRAAWWTAVVLVMPPDFLLYWAHQARTHYPLALVLGCLALLLAHRAAAAPRPRAGILFFLLGLVLGLGFWTNFLVLVFFPPAALLLARGGVRRLAAGTLPALAAFALGSLPHWLYGLPHGTAIPPAGPGITLGAALSHLGVFRRVSWPVLVGVPAGLRPTWAGAVLAGALAVLYGVALLAALRGIRDRARSGRWLASALACLAAVNVVVALGTVYGRALDDHDQRYLLPLYSALMPVLGVWLARQPVGRAAVIASAVILVHAAGAVTGTLESFRPSTAADQADRAEARQRAAERLAREGPRHLYDRNPSARLLTFLSGGRVIFSDPIQEIVARHALEVDGTPGASWSAGSRVLDASLVALGAKAEIREIDRRGAVYVDFAVSDPPLVELDPDRFQVEASEASAVSGSVADRRADTVWRTAGPQQGGEWLQVDLGTTARVALVRWLPGAFEEVPRGIRLEASVDGIAWRVLLDLPGYDGPLYWSAGRPMARVRAGRVELRVQSVPARHLRISQTGRDARWPWSVRELLVYAEAGEGARAASPTLDGGTLAGALHEAGVTRLYADHGWAARVALADASIRVPPANLFLDDYGFRGPPGDLLPAFRWTPGSGVLLEPVDGAGFVRSARRAGLEWSTRRLDGLELFVPLPRSAAPAARAAGAAASRHPEHATRAVDGKPETRWTTRGPRRMGDWFRVDLGATRRVRAIRVSTASPTELPEVLQLEVSTDGATWRRVAAATHVERTLRWGGITLLADFVTALRLEVEPVDVRALRLVLAEGHRTAGWAIDELEVHAAE